MKTPTDEQLKQTLAKMLPESIKWTVSPPQYPDWCCLVWLNSTPTREVLDTELLHLCWLVEGTALDYNKELNNYAQWLDRMVNPEGGIGEYMFRATWQQRVIALAEVKGIDIV